jgi:hypothetical protein
LIVIFVADIAFPQFWAGLHSFLPSNVREINCRDSYSSDSSPDKPPLTPISTLIETGLVRELIQGGSRHCFVRTAMRRTPAIINKWAAVSACSRAKNRLVDCRCSYEHSAPRTGKYSLARGGFEKMNAIEVGQHADCRLNLTGTFLEQVSVSH